MIPNRETFITLLNTHNTPGGSFEIVKLYCLYRGKDEKEVDNFIKLLSLYQVVLDFPSIYYIAKEYLMGKYNVNTIYKNNNPILYY